MTVATLDPVFENIRWAVNSVGSSGESETLWASLREAQNHILVPIVVGERLRGVLQDLDEIKEGCSHDDWDGYGAKSITTGAQSEAEKFLCLLPPTLPMPQISPESSGGIAFEWHKDKTHAFVVAFSGRGNIVFAGVNGVDNRLRGTVYFGDFVPTFLVENIRQVLGT